MFYLKASQIVELKRKQFQEFLVYQTFWEKFRFKQFAQVFSNTKAIHQVPRVVAWLSTRFEFSLMKIYRWERDAGSEKDEDGENCKARWLDSCENNASSDRLVALLNFLTNIASCLIASKQWQLLSSHASQRGSR